MKISIVIPTRNGSPYIEYCLKTCLDTDCQDIEVIVSDNFSTDNTRSIVEGFLGDKRLRYYNTGESLSMRQNYEFALSHVTGDYVIFIGDDDGIVKNGLRILRSVIDKYQPDAINWKMIHYTWPNTISEHSPEDVRYDFNDLYDAIEFKNPATIMKEFCNATYVKYKAASGLYHGCVKRSVIEGLRGPDGTFFQAQIPDVYSSLAILSKAKVFLTIGYPVSIGGESKKSTGLALLGNSGKQNLKAVADSFIGLSHQDSIENEWPTNIRSVVAITYACLCRVNEKICNGALPIDHALWRKKILEHIHSLAPEKRIENEADLDKFFSRNDLNYNQDDKLPHDLNPARDSIQVSPSRTFFGTLKDILRSLFPFKRMPDIEVVSHRFTRSVDKDFNIFANEKRGLCKAKKVLKSKIMFRYI